jgi:GAF domain-containing protein
VSQTSTQVAALALDNARLRAEAEQRLLELERRRRVAEGLRDLMAIVNSTTDFEEILLEVLAQSTRLLGNDASVIYLRESDQSEVLRARAWVGLEPDRLAREIRIGSPITGLAVEQARTLVCEDLPAATGESTRAAKTQLEEADGFARLVHFGAQANLELERGSPRSVDQLSAVASTPLVARGQVFGAIALYYAEPRGFSTEEVDLARMFAEQATQAIESARLHAELQRRVHENERRRRVAEGMRDLLASVNSTRSLDEVLDLVLGQAAGVLGCEAGSVLLLDSRKDNQAVLKVRASRALVADLIPSRLPIGTAITGVAVERGRSVVVSDLQHVLPAPGESELLVEEQPGCLKMLRIGGASDSARILEVARYYRSILAVPLSVRGRVQGALTLFYRRPRDFSREELGLAEAFADQTALAVENARLHAETELRSRDLEALYRADEILYRSLDLRQVLQALVDVGSDVLEADMCSVLVWDELHERLVPGATRGFRPESVAQMSHAPGEGITTRVAASGEPIAVEDAMNDPRVAHRITDAEGIRSLLHVPIKVNGQVFGVFGVNYVEPRALSGEEERVLLALAHRAAVAIENAQIYTESQQRRSELEALYRADESLHSSLRLEDVLHALVNVATDVMHADRISVSVWDPERRQLVTAAARGYSPESIAAPLTAGEDVVIEDVMGTELLVISDAANDTRLATPRLRSLVQREGIRTALAAPIIVAGQPFGLFWLSFCTEHLPSAGEQRLAQALAQRAGLAVHNARLFEQARHVATLEERQRLARELHDAVTQTLFSSSLIAEILPRLFARDPDQALHRLEELRRLTRGALAEMRALLVELRPPALVATPFTQLLDQLAASMSLRAAVQIDVHAETDERPLPPEVQIGLYRITQEALNNVVKHAAATQAQVRFRRHGAGAELRIRDDGQGFDTHRTPPGHLGLSIMRERAKGINARLQVHSRIGSGTRINVRWSESGAPPSLTI